MGSERLMLVTNLGASCGVAVGHPATGLEDYFPIKPERVADVPKTRFKLRVHSL